MFRIFFLVLISMIASTILALENDNLKPYGARPPEEYSNRSFYDSDENRYVFEYDGDEKITYSIDLDSREVQKGYINIEANINGDVCYPIAYGGLKFRTSLPEEEGDNTGYYLIPLDYREDTDVKITAESFVDGNLALEYREFYMDYEHYWVLEYTIEGKSLIIHVSSKDVETQGNYCGLYFDRSLDTYNPRSLILPYVVEPDVVFNDKYFYSIYIDKSKSSASDIKPYIQDFSDDSIYAFAESWNYVNSIEEQVPIDEVCYLTVSSHIIDVQPSVNNESFPTRDLMNDRIVLEYYRVKPADIEAFNSSRILFENMFYYGLRDVLLIYHHWQNHGYDIQLPDQYPPGKKYGGPDDFQKLVDFTKEAGWLFAPHENYVLMHEDYDDDFARYDDYYVSRHPGWGILNHPLKNNVYSQNNFLITTDKMIYFAALESAELEFAYDTTASFLDLNPGNNPSALNQIDLDAQNPSSNSFKICVANTKNLFQFIRNLHGGPVVGEGGVGWGRFDTFYAGYIDGVDRNTERGNHAFITPEHELKVIKPLQANYGMGQFERYFDYKEEPPTKYYDLDLYRASEIAFGHAGYYNLKNEKIFDNLILLNCSREYYLMQQLQKRYLPRDVVPIKILYYDQEQWITQDELILENRNLEDVLLKIVYSNGLNIWINHKDDNFIWEPDIYNGITMPIPPNGFVALKTTGEIFLACSIQINNDRIDYVLSDEYIFAENRSHVASDIGYIATDGQAILQKNAFNFFDIHLLEGSNLF
ncbi:hypothetical protein KKB18_03080, partial [bacterium]|nr:hypothetical protein [bacterium]